MPNGSRIKGELFGDESVQKVLRAGGVAGQFQKYVKYPRTYHLPWSPGATDDDRVLTDEELEANFVGRMVVVTEKMDGENTTMYNDYIHARSLDSASHPSREWVKNLHAQIQWQIPDGWRICGENLYASHTLHYAGLPSYFIVFSVWDENNICQSWDDTACRPGDLVRVAEQFPYGSFRKSVAKYVREDEGGGKEPYARHGGRLIGLSGWACSPPSGAGPRPAAASQAARTGFQ